MTDIDAELRESARELVLPGFLDRADALAALEEMHELEEGDPAARLALETVWSDRLAEQATWDGPGAHGRVRAAFDALESNGVLARMSFSCCQTCATEEIGDERSPNGSAEGYPFREWAFTYFHQQDADRLADEPAVLYLSYGAFRPAPGIDPALLDAASQGDDDAHAATRAASQLAAGQHVVEALREQGLTVDWDGDTGRRIAVTVPSWRKPLPS